jgi:NNP family nitrate/nitrite transporter-like MFS transporter
MPLVVAGLMVLGVSTFWAWRGAMFLAGLGCLAAGVAYYFFTQDSPEGNFRQLRAEGRLPRRKTELAGVWSACRDVRVWGLFVAYAASFGVELTMDNVAATYFFDHFDFGHRGAGFVAGLFGAMNLFARFLGGWVADRLGRSGGLRARFAWLGAVLFAEGLLLVCFGCCGGAGLALVALLALGLFVKMGNGAAYAIVPLVHRDNLGAVAGIVGAGGNVGAVLAGFLFRAPGHEWPLVLQTLGVVVACCAAIPFALAVLERPTTQTAADQAAFEPAI